MGNRDMRCALCNEARRLEKSHIIPEFLFGFLYDEKHRAYVLTTEEKRGVPFIQKGYREKLLCQECEGRISVYEKYAAERVFRTKLTRMPDKCDDELWTIDGIDYRSFKLFHLSILWRASVAKSKMFSKVDLGPHEERIRTLLWSEDPGSSIAYPCMAFALCSDARLVKDYIDAPERVRALGHILYRFSFGGFFWIYFVSAHNLPAFAKDSILSEKGSMKIHSVKVHNIEYVSDFVNHLRYLNRIPTVNY